MCFYAYDLGHVLKSTSIQILFGATRARTWAPMAITTRDVLPTLQGMSLIALSRLDLYESSRVLHLQDLSSPFLRILLNLFPLARESNPNYRSSRSICLSGHVSQRLPAPPIHRRCTRLNANRVPRLHRAQLVRLVHPHGHGNHHIDLLRAGCYGIFWSPERVRQREGDCSAGFDAYDTMSLRLSLRSRTPQKTTGRHGSSSL